jgi:hypothetical protein
MCSVWEYQKCPDYWTNLHEKTGREVWAVLGYVTHDTIVQRVLENFSHFEIKKYSKEGMNIYILMDQNEQKDTETL